MGLPEAANEKACRQSAESWLYVPEDHVVYVQNADQIFKSKMAVRFLSGMGKLQEDFSIRFAESGAVDKEGNYQLTLVPKRPGLEPINST